MNVSSPKFIGLLFLFFLASCGSKVSSNENTKSARYRSTASTPSYVVGTGEGPAIDSRPSSNRPCRLQNGSGVMRNCRENAFLHCSWDKEFCALRHCDPGYVVDRRAHDSAVCIPRSAQQVSKSAVAKSCTVVHGRGILREDGSCLVQNCDDGYFIVDLEPIGAPPHCAPL